YTLKETPSNATGTFTSEEQTVTYVYVKGKKITPSTESNKPSKPEENGLAHPVNSQGNHDRQLPQTGEQVLAWGSTVGAFLLSLVGYIFYKRKG
ncbi:LPXTG cell wall anchor domain-containing protein, partial [Enterococcus faecalis]